jgi:hypothetical protein
MEREAISPGEAAALVELTEGHAYGDAYPRPNYILVGGAEACRDLITI